MPDYYELLPCPDRTTFNVGLKSASNAEMLQLFGNPVKGGAYDPKGKCTDPNVPAFVKRLTTASVGPFRVTGITPAVDSLRAVLARVKAELPDLYTILRTDGMYCARFTKIKQPNGTIKIGPGISNHSWGTAVDIKLRGKSDEQGDDLVLRGLFVLSAYFNAAGWYWGAAFPREDAMHFEVSKSLLARWKKDGLI